MRLPSFILFLVGFLTCLHVGAQNGRNRISVPIFAYINSSSYNNGYGGGVGIKYNSHEFGFLARYEKWIGHGTGAYYRWNLPRASIPCRPYLTLMGVNNYQLNFAYVSSTNTYFDARLFGLWASFGFEYMVLKTIGLYGSIGIGKDWIRVREIDLRGSETTGTFNFGMRYNLRLSGKPDTTVSLVPFFAREEFLWLSFRGGFWPGQPFGESANLHPSLEMRLTKIVHPYLGLFVGGIDSTRTHPRKDPLVLKGIGLGFRFFTMSTSRWAVNQELGYVYAKHQAWNYKGSRIIIGNIFNYKLVKGFDAFAGFYLNYLEDDHYFETSFGLRVDPIRWWRRNL